MMFRHRAYYTKLINSRRWRETRRMVMLRDRGLCVDCAAEGRATVAVEVHHVRPVEWEHTSSAMERLMFDPSNLVCLCHACHRRRHRELMSGDRARQRERERERTERRFEDLIHPHGAPVGLRIETENDPGGLFFERGEGA